MVKQSVQLESHSMNIGTIIGQVICNA